MVCDRHSSFIKLFSCPEYILESRKHIVVKMLGNIMQYLHHLNPDFFHELNLPIDHYNFSFLSNAQEKAILGRERNAPSCQKL